MFIPQEGTEMELSPDSSTYLCTLTELNQDTDGIVRTINEQDKPVVITLRGQYVAIMQPLTTIDNLEGQLIGAAIANGDIVLDEGCPVYTSEEVARSLGIAPGEQSVSDG